MNTSKGFTIIEMLVVVAIVALLPAIIISNFPAARNQFALSRTAYKFAQDVRRAQDMVLSSRQYKDQFGVVQPVSGYGVYADLTLLGNKEYIIYADKSPGNQQYDPFDYTVETIDMGQNEKGVIIKEIDNVTAGSVSINFNPPNPDTVITQLLANESNVNVVFALESDPTQTKTVSINKAGLIEVR